jgi:hypothetical protein
MNLLPDIKDLVLVLNICLIILLLFEVGLDLLLQIAFHLIDLVKEPVLGLRNHFWDVLSQPVLNFQANVGLRKHLTLNILLSLLHLTHLLLYQHILILVFVLLQDVHLIKNSEGLLLRFQAVLYVLQLREQLLDNFILLLKEPFLKPRLFNISRIFISKSWPRVSQINLPRDRRLRPVLVRIILTGVI